MAKVKKGILTQGTNVWIKHGEAGASVLTKMVCIKGIVIGDDTPTEIDNTCLEEEDSKTSVHGLNTPGEGSITIDTDPKNATHLTLLQIADDREFVEVFVGLSDGSVEPTLAVDDVTLPEGRSWTSFTARLRNSAPVIEPDSLVSHTISMKRQSRAITAWKTT